MFCPKCGGENADGIAFCRACGESLTLVNQVLKGHTPVALISRIDTVLDTGYERLRRDAVLWLFWAMAWSVVVLSRSSWGIFASIQLVAFVLLFSLMPAVLMFILAGWNFLLFRRAKEISVRGPSLRDRGLQLPFCPRCGIRQEGRSDFCPDCGFGLAGLTETDSRSYLKLELDAALLQRLSTSGRSLRGMIIEAFLWSGTGLLVANSSLLSAAFYFLIALSRTVVNIWDFVHFRRKAGTEVSVPAQILSELAAPADLDENRIRRRKRLYELLLLASPVVFALAFVPVDVDMLLLGRPRPTWTVWLQLAAAIGLFLVGWRGQILQKRAAAILALQKGQEESQTKLNTETPDQLTDVDAEQLTTARLMATRKLNS